MVQAYYQWPGEIYALPWPNFILYRKRKEHTTGASVNVCVTDF